MIRTLLVCSVLALAGLFFLPRSLAVEPDNSSEMKETASSPKDAEVELDILEDSEDRVVAALPNRMVILAQRLPVAPVVSAQIWVKTGSIYEQEHVGAGLSHFLEHLLSGGSTTTRTEAESNAILARIGGQVNAATSLDTVRYFINAPSEHAEPAIDLLSDWVRNNKITEQEFEREQQVIRSEFAMGRGDPGRVFWKLTQQARYADLPTHPARHPTIGYLEEFETITREEIVDFYRRMYVPNNMVFVVAGDVDPRAMVEAVAERWHDAEPGELPDVSFPVASDPETRKPETGDRSLSARADIERPRVRLAFPGTRLAGEHDYALDLLAIILGQGESSRLVSDLRDERGLVTSISAFNLSFNWGEGFFGIDFQPADFPVHIRLEDDAAAVRIAEVQRNVLSHLRRLRNEPVTDAELERAKRKTMSRIVQSGQSAYDLAARLGRDTSGMHDPDYLLEYEKAIRSLTAEDLRAAAEAILGEEELIEVTLLPLEEGEAPTPLERPDVEAVPNVTEREVELDNRALLADLRKNVGDASGREPIVVGEPAMFTLDNGLRLIVQRSTVVPAASMRVFWKGGLLADEPGREGVANAAAEMLTRGTQRHTAAELASRIDSLGATLTAAAGNNTTYVSATALTADVPTMVDLVAEVMLRPTFPEQEWQRMRPRLLAAIDRQRDSWFGELNHAFRNAYYGEHPWSVTPLGRREVIAELTPERIAEHHASRLGAKQTVISVVGDVDPAQVRDRVAAAFSELPPEAEAAFEPAEPTAPAATVMQASTEKQIAAVYVGLGPGVARAHEDYPALRVLTTVLSDFPAGWLERALRGEGGGIAYSVSAWTQTGLVPGHQAIVFNSRADAVLDGIAESFDVLRRARAGDFTEADLERATTKLVAEEARRRQANAGRAMDYALDTLYGVPDPLSDAAADRIEAITLDDLTRVAKRHLTDPVTVVLLSDPLDESALREAASLTTSPPLEPLAD